MKLNRSKSADYLKKNMFILTDFIVARVNEMVVIQNQFIECHFYVMINKKVIKNIRPTT